MVSALGYDRRHGSFGCMVLTMAVTDDQATPELYITFETEYQTLDLVYYVGMTTAPQSAPAPASPPPTLRNRATRAVRAEIAAVAVRLFLAQGFDKTTVDQIAAEAGLSRASFFRYFGSKEDVLLGHLEELGHKVADALAARPAHEPAWQALRRSFDLLIEERLAYPDEGLTLRRILHDTPSLQARQLGKQLGWQDLLAPEVARRRRPRRRPRPAAARAGRRRARLPQRSRRRLGRRRRRHPPTGPRGPGDGRGGRLDAVPGVPGETARHPSRKPGSANPSVAWALII